MNAAELRDALGISDRQLSAWIKRGLPHKGNGSRRRFQEPAVRAWLIGQGLAVAEVDEPPPSTCKIATTLAEVGAHFHVAERTAAGWRSKGMPGEPGNYPLDEIRDWHEQVIRPAAGNEHQIELMKTRAESERFKLRRDMGQLVDVEEPARIMRQAFGMAAAILDQIPDRAVATLPQGTSDVDRENARQRIQETVDNARISIASALEEWGMKLSS